LITFTEETKILSDRAKGKKIMVKEIAFKINEISTNYKIGALQTIRTELKKFKRRPGTVIFHESTINDDDEWAFHYGGRKELQFNIGIEEDDLRYGIALSFEASQTLPDISHLFPKAKKLNQFIRQYPEFFTEYKMWYYQENKKSTIDQVHEISVNLLEPHTFIFIGKQLPVNGIDYKEVLTTFDELIVPYVFVEKENSTVEDGFFNDRNNEFTFEVKNRKLPKNREFTIKEKSINLNVRHTLLQDKMYKLLCEKYGYENVSLEQCIGNKKVDIVLRKNNSIIFYEIKINDSAKACIREAIGQLMEYAYWPNNINADSLVVVGEESVDNNTSKYLKHLKDKFNLPIQYEKIEID
jgi:hypothetical protein